MVFGRRYWIYIWYGILLLGLLGLAASVYWGRQTKFKNLEEIFRATGTICVSVGMILLLRQVWIILGQILLIVALGSFVTAFIVGRRAEAHEEKHQDGIEL
jgi:hypothetical protein